jgi:hypothetical protein
MHLGGSVISIIHLLWTNQKSPFQEEVDFIIFEVPARELYDDWLKISIHW